MMIRRLAIAIPVIVLPNLAALDARTIHVAPDGDDDNSGAQESPVRTIQKAADVARAGDVVLVRNGVYKGLVLLRHSGEPDKPIVFRNAPGETPVVDGEGRGRIELQSEEGWRMPIGWVTFEGFEVRNGWDGIKFYNAHHIVLKGNAIHDNRNQGILGNGHHVRIEGNTIVHNGFKPDNETSNKEHGVYATATDFEILENIIHSNRAYGIQVAGYPYTPDSHAGPEFAGARRWRIGRNIIAFEQNRSGIVVWQPDATDCVIENNILYRNAVTLGHGDCQGIAFVGAGGGHVIRKNLFFGQGRTSISGGAELYAASDNLEEKDPLFVDADRFDFRLRPDSPAAGIGFGLERFFTPPDEFKGKLGDLRPLLKFEDGAPVTTAQDWSRRREEILRYWHGVMGAWPPLIEVPRVKRLGKEHVESFTRHKVEVEVAPDMLVGPQYLLVPDGQGPFPAVLVTWYGSEDSAGLTEKARGTVDFGYQLAKRGFVALCIGGLADDPARRIQPLSFLAYAAANCCRALAAMPDVDPRRIGVVGHSFGGKWAMFASCLHEGFACAVWVDPGIVWNEKDANANYWEPWYLGYEFGRPADQQRKEGIPREGNPRTGAYKMLVAEGHDLHELHALMAPRPFLVSGGAQDRPEHWKALNHAIAVNELLGRTGRVAMTMRDGHTPTVESNAQVYAFLEHFLREP